MKIAVHSDLKLKTFSLSKSYVPSRVKKLCLINFKFYQKLFVVLISLSTILIFPESPRELENICKSYNSRNLCNVW